MSDARHILSEQSLGGRYRLDEPLGEGGMALVVKGWDQDLDVARAVKVLLPALAKKRSLRERFESEARIMARLEHPHIVRVYDVGLHGKIPYIAMELLPGGSLETWLEANGPMPARQAVDVLLDLCAAVSHAHANGVIHRDIKPHNVLIAANGSVKLTDFGIARTDHGKTKTGAAMGTLGYVAPEQLANAKSATAAADVYSLAVTLWKLLTDGSPERLAYDLEHGALDPIPDSLVPVLRAALAQRVEGRTPDVATFQSALLSAQRHLADAGVRPLAHSPRSELDEEQAESLQSTLFDIFEHGTPSLRPQEREVPPAPQTPVPRPPERKGPYVVRLTDEDVEATLQARQARKRRGAEKDDGSDEDMVDRLGAEAREDDEGWLARVVRSAGAGLRATAIGMTLMVVPIAIVLGLRTMDQALDLKSRREVLVQSAAVMVDTVVFEGPNAVKEREAKAGDRQELVERYLALEDARTRQEKERAAVDFVEAVALDIATTLPEDPTQWSEAQRAEVDRLIRMRNAVEAYRAARVGVEDAGGDPEAREE